MTTAQEIGTFGLLVLGMLIDLGVLFIALAESGKTTTKKRKST